MFISSNESPYAVSLTIHKPTLTYLDWFLRLRCTTDLLLLKLFPNAKEITESAGVVRAAKNYLYTKFQDSKVLLLDLGCGSTPRTAALFAFLTQWTCIAVDPYIRDMYLSNTNIQRVICYPTQVENVINEILNIASNYKLIIITSTHGHVNLQWVKNIFDAYYFEHQFYISLPCCQLKRQTLNIQPTKVYNDWGIHSPQRTIYIWDMI